LLERIKAYTVADKPKYITRNLLIDLGIYRNFGGQLIKIFLKIIVVVILALAVRLKGIFRLGNDHFGCFQSLGTIFSTSFGLQCFNGRLIFLGRIRRRIRRCFGCSLQVQTIDQLHTSLFYLGSFRGSARARPAIVE
jgi:hypothetical protein